MNTLSAPVGLARSKKITWQIIDADNVVNWVLGIALILVPDFFNKLLFGHELISHWIYIVLGLAWLWFAVWQLDNFIKSRILTVPALRFSVLLNGLLVVMLTAVLLSKVGEQMRLMPRMLLWASNLIALGEGVWYGWMAKNLEI